MEKITNIIVIIVIALIGIGFLWANSDNSIPQTATEVRTLKPAQSQPVETNKDYTAQNQCAVDAKDYFDSYVKDARPQMQKIMGIGSDDKYNFSYHYNKTMSHCFISIHSTVISTIDGYLYENYNLFTLPPSSSSISAKLSHYFTGNRAGFKTIITCVVNSTPCTSIEQYGNLVWPYLNL